MEMKGVVDIITKTTAMREMRADFRDILLLDLHEQVFWQTSKNWYNLMVIKDY